MSPHLLRCITTYYNIRNNALHETTREERTGYTLRKGGRNHELYLYLDNCSASAPLVSLLEGARKGKGWLAQAGAPPVRVDGKWVGRIWPKIYVDADALLELAQPIEEN